MALTNYLEDDWDDNALTSRTGASKDVFYEYGDGGAGDLLKGVYRPRWDTQNGSPSATNSELQLSAGNSTLQRVGTPSQLVVGSWEIDYQENSSSSSGGGNFAFMAQSTSWGTNHPTDGYNILFNLNGTSILLQKSDAASNSTLVTGSASNDTSVYTTKITRDSYGSFELFVDTVSQGTSTDTTFTDMGDGIMMINNAANVRTDWDNLVVK